MPRPAAKPATFWPGPLIITTRLPRRALHTSPGRERASTTWGPSMAAEPNRPPWPRPSHTPATASRQHTAARLPMLPLPRVPASICAQHPANQQVSRTEVFPPGRCAWKHVAADLRVQTCLLVSAHTPAGNKPPVQRVCLSGLRPHCLLLRDTFSKSQNTPLVTETRTTAAEGGNLLLLRAGARRTE